MRFGHCCLSLALLAFSCKTTRNAVKIPDASKKARENRETEGVVKKDDDDGSSALPKRPSPMTPDMEDPGSGGGSMEPPPAPVAAIEAYSGTYYGCQVSGTGNKSNAGELIFDFKNKTFSRKVQVHDGTDCLGTKLEAPVLGNFPMETMTLKDDVISFQVKDANVIKSFDFKIADDTLHQVKFCNGTTCTTSDLIFRALSGTYSTCEANGSGSMATELVIDLSKKSLLMQTQEFDAVDCKTSPVAGPEKFDIALESFSNTNSFFTMIGTDGNFVFEYVFIPSPGAMRLEKYCADDVCPNKKPLYTRKAAPLN